MSKQWERDCGMLGDVVHMDSLLRGSVGPLRSSTEPAPQLRDLVGRPRGFNTKVAQGDGLQGTGNANT